MGNENSGNRPIPIDWKKVDSLLIAGCNGRQIAGTLGISEDTLYLRCKSEKGILFSLYSAEKNSTGEGMIIAGQFNCAIKGNWHALAFLGKTRLKQVEAQPEKLEPTIPNERILEMEDKIAKLEYQLLNATKPKTDSELQRSDSTLQYLDGGNIIGQDAHINQEADRTPT